jgi:Flp pilus assembly protein TadD
VIGAEPGTAYEVSAWEYAFRGLAKGGSEGAAIFAEGMERFPEHASLRYNLACMHALDGNGEQALTALRRAIELNPQAREWALADEDLQSLRGSEEFDALLAAG